MRKNRRSHRIAANANSVERVELAEFGHCMKFKSAVLQVPNVSLPHLTRAHFLFSESAQLQV